MAGGLTWIGDLSCNWAYRGQVELQPINPEGIDPVGIKLTEVEEITGG